MLQMYDQAPYHLLTAFSDISRLSSRPRASTNSEHSQSRLSRKAPQSRSKHQRVQSDLPPRVDYTDQGQLFNQKGGGERGSVSDGSVRKSQLLSHPRNETLQPLRPETSSPDPGQSDAPKRRQSMDLLDTVRGSSLGCQQKDEPEYALEPQCKLAVMSNTTDIPTDGHGEVGYVFDELVNRLLAQAISKTDVRFAAIFLCLYREFSAPSILLSAVISRFERVDTGEGSQTIRTTAQLRYLGVVARWISEYPGDFAHPATRLKMRSFISGLAGQRAFVMVVKEITRHLDLVSEDDDTAWACSDIVRSRTAIVETFLSISPTQSISSTSDAQNANENPAYEEQSSGDPPLSPNRRSTTPSIASSAEKLSNQSGGSVQGLPTSLESAQTQARLLKPFSRSSLSKAHWHLFMRLSDEDVAQELTRIDWIMFSAIRPRDLVRYVSLSEGDKGNCKNLENVTRMIHQFNHIAFWIANIILLRDKPKHRAKALEKCMAIAWVSRSPSRPKS